MLKGFKDFILRGNVIDLAVAVVIGAAFTALIAAITANLIEPILNSPGSTRAGGVST
jgi:large conductance mechanosensitive channel